MRIFYTDGSASPNPGPGGFSVIENGKPLILGSEPGNTSNIRMEGKALLNALIEVDGQPVTIYTDSEFWINVLTKWAPAWQTNNWVKKKGDIKNLDIVRPLYDAYKASQSQLIWVRGHVGTEGNELADHWANQARERDLGNEIVHF